jgi:hypothetical protein
MSEIAVLHEQEQIAMFRLLTLRQALKLEMMGMKMSRGKTAYSIIKAELGLKGSRETVFKELSIILGKD